ncbi:MAG: hypothetical protein ABSE47_06080 [Acidimicrobiales bacterium]|jgi:hypothetical protein
MTADLARHIRTVGRLLACLAAGLWLVVLLAPSASAAPSTGGPSAATSTVGTASCPKGATCETIPAKCPTGTVCPEIIVSPAANLGSNQWVFITAKHFPAGDPIYVYYCMDEHSLAYYAKAQGGPLCMLQATAELLSPQVVLTASPSGTASISFATEENPSHDGNTAFNAKIPGTQTTGSFFCDDTPDPCSLDMTDPLLHSGGTVDLSLSPANAAAVPISFAKPTGGCPKANFVPTASEFGIDRLFPIGAQFDCVGKAPAIAVNFARDSLSAVTALAGGAYDMAFIDDPNAADVQAALKQFRSGSRPGYALVPVALSSQVIAFKATMSAILTNRIFPDDTFELTPNMVAGLVTDYYAFVNSADVANCGSVYGGNCSLLSALNTLNGFRGPAEFGGYVRADASSSTSELFNWLCHAPTVPVYLGKQRVLETKSAASILVTGLRAGGATKVRSCPDSDVFPSLVNTFAWVAGSDPSVQTLKLSGFVPPPNGSISPVAGFAPMNASEANYYGLLPAALQNAAGKFVLPTAKSLDAAVAGATHNPNGTLSPNIRDKNPAAYPLPQIWYAVVPTGNLSATAAQADRTLLDDMLKLSAGSQTADLPTGFVPLPKSLAGAAASEIGRDVVATPTTTTTTTTIPTTTTTTPVAVTTTTKPTVTATTQPKVTGSTTPKAPPTTRAFHSTAFSVRGRSDSWLAPTFVSVVAGAMLCGPGLLLKTRRRPGRVI